MKPTLASVAFLSFMFAALASTAVAQAPAGSTGQCKDGSYSSAPSKRGACAGHGGVKQWYENKKGAVESDAPAAAVTPAPATTAAKPAAKTSEMPTPATTAAKSAPKTSEMPTTAAAGGGPGKVWVNTSSKVYHCSTDKWYGKTKHGEYMSEADAKAKGNHADHNKSCA